MQIATVFNQFWRIRYDLDLNATEIGLFFAILSEINRARAEDNDVLGSEVQIRTSKLEILAGISRSEIYRLRNRLKQIGLIEFKNGKSKGNYATYSLGKIFQKLIQNDASDETSLKVSLYETLNETVNETLNETVNETLNETVNETLNETHNNKNKEYRIENKEYNKEFPYGNSATKVASNPPKWYLSLSERQREIVDTWRSVIGPFDPKWLPLLSKVLLECYPAQIKNAIVVLARTKADVLKERGFEYVAEPLLKGAFGKRSKQRKKQPAGFASKLTGLKQFLEEGGDDA